MFWLDLSDLIVKYIVSHSDFMQLNYIHSSFYQSVKNALMTHQWVILSEGTEAELQEMNAQSGKTEAVSVCGKLFCKSIMVGMTSRGFFLLKDDFFPLHSLRAAH